MKPVIIDTSKAQEGTGISEMSQQFARRVDKSYASLKLQEELKRRKQKEFVEHVLEMTKPGKDEEQELSRAWNFVKSVLRPPNGYYLVGGMLLALGGYVFRGWF